MAQITYDNKVDLQENPDVLPINKVMADDMNEIKEVVNQANISYGNENNVAYDQTVYANDFKCKNLANNIILTQTINGITITKNTDNSLTLNGTSTQAFNVTIATVDLEGGNTYTISGVENASDSTVRLDMRNAAGGSVYGNWLLPTNPSQEVVSDVTLYFNMRIASGATFNNVVIKPQIEIGDTATEYTSYKEFNPIFPSYIGQRSTGAGLTFSFEDGTANSCYLIVISKGYTDGTFGGMWFIRQGGTAASRICVTPNYESITMSVSRTNTTFTCTFSASATYCIAHIYRI